MNDSKTLEREKVELKSLGKQVVTMSPRELMAGVYPAMDRIMQIPMPGETAYVFSKNWRQVVKAVNQVNEMRQQYLLENNLIEKDEQGRVKFEKAGDSMEELPVFVNPEARMRFQEFDQEYMTNGSLSLPVHKISAAHLARIHNIPPALLNMIEPLLFEEDEA